MRPTTPQREPGAAPRKAGSPGMVLRVAVSIFIVWHFTGVFLAALSIPMSSPLVFSIAQQGIMQWYLDALYMNQGHSFFAPDVGPGHLIRYQLYDQNNQVIEQGDFPSRKEHWPRLLYHRYFMLADQADIGSDDRQESDKWQRRYLEAYGRQLLRSHDQARMARVVRYAQWPLPASNVAGGIESVDRDIQTLKDQKRFEEATDLSRNKIKEAMSRGYRVFANEFPREMQNRRIDGQGYELVGQVDVRRSDLEPDARKQSMNWQYNRPYPSNTPNTASRPWGTPR
jgi:hypothetical protein